MFKLIDIETGKMLKKAKHVYNLFDYIDTLIASGKYKTKQLKVILK